ncbi:hypothetical protein [Fibrella forsythiae]|uniref:Uncharacterized protein n=1 Tax=Fibrella forsythiae TaxID=2817061 RepID=A0ABS3JPW3_9BACT|nr:hypothetical protein [Fibrella forsythiae]MBO0952040.1 hypothetical protein [Fibrella forsythiae]
MDTDQTRSPHSSDDTTNSDHEGDNLNQKAQENSANGLDSTEVRGGQNGRNIRAMGSQDMDSQNGVLRQNDMSNGAMDVPDEAFANAAASENQTKTATVSVTTAGPDDYASDAVVSVPNAQKEAKKQDDDESSDDSSDNDSVESQEETEEDVANTGTSTDHQPTY